MELNDIDRLTERAQLALVQGVYDYRDAGGTAKYPDRIVYCRVLEEGSSTSIFERGRLGEFFDQAGDSLGEASRRNRTDILKAASEESGNGEVWMWVDAPDQMAFILIDIDGFFEDERLANNADKGLN